MGKNIREAFFCFTRSDFGILVANSEKCLYKLRGWAPDGHCSEQFPPEN